MARLIFLAAFSLLLVVPAAAQVINGETPLDETTVKEAPQPVVQPHPVAPESSVATPAAAPTRPGEPSADSRHE